MFTKPASRDEFLSKIWKPFPQSQKQSLSLSELPFSGQAVTRGRLVAFGQGKAVLSANDCSRVFLISDALKIANFSATEVLRAGDIVEVHAVSSGPQSEWQITAISLLVPSSGDAPFGENTFALKHSSKWPVFLNAVRSFFENEKFVELRTPTLVASPGLEPYLDPFKTEFHFGRERRPYFLPTSPEFHLKKALTMGFERCFEFKECFRNGEISEHHQPEFLMLEWYRAYADSEQLMKDCSELIVKLQKQFKTGAVKPPSVVKMESLWSDIFDFELTPATTAGELSTLANRKGIAHQRDESFDDLFARLFLEFIEPELVRRDEPVIVWHYPPSQAALARLTGDGWADRFELYWKGFEIANAFHELNDPAEQRRRFKLDQEKKLSLGKEVVPVDEDFLKALDYGMPPSAGIALGVERLFMAIFGISKLEEARLFAVKV